MTFKEYKKDGEKTTKYAVQIIFSFGELVLLVILMLALALT